MFSQSYVFYDLKRTDFWDWFKIGKIEEHTPSNLDSIVDTALTLTWKLIFVSNVTFSFSFIFEALYSIPGPTSLKVVKVNSSTVVARWDPIPEEFIPKVLLGYSVNVVSRNNRQSFSTTNTSRLLKNLKDWEHYTVYVSGYTRHIGGYPSTVTFNTRK